MPTTHNNANAAIQNPGPCRGVKNNNTTIAISAAGFRYPQQRESGVVNGLDHHISISIQPPLSGKLKRMGKCRRHRKRSQQNCGNLYRVKHSPLS